MDNIKFHTTCHYSVIAMIIWWYFNQWVATLKMMCEDWRQDEREAFWAEITFDSKYEKFVNQFYLFGCLWIIVTIITVITLPQAWLFLILRLSTSYLLPCNAIFVFSVWKSCIRHKVVLILLCKYIRLFHVSHNLKNFLSGIQCIL